MTAITWPGSNGTAFDAGLWTTRTVLAGGGAGSDTFTVQSAKGRIACAATADASQQARYTAVNGQHSTTLGYRGKITWSAGNNITAFSVRSDNVPHGANTDDPTNGYVFEFNTTINEIVCYKIIAAAPSVISSAPAAASFTFASATEYNVLFSLSGYTLGVKLWTGAEPGPYTYTCTDAGAAISSSTVGNFMWGNYHTDANASNVDIGDAVFTSNLDAIRRPTLVRR